MVFQVIRNFRGLRQRAILLLVCCGVMVACWISLPLLSQTKSPQVQVFEQVWQTVNDNFYDPEFNGVDWKAERKQYASQAANAPSPQEFATVVNRMLSELKASHTHFYTQTEPEYYQLAGIFWPGIREELEPLLPEDKLEYTGIGVYTRAVEGKIFVRAILEGSPAAKAGLQVGDEIVSVEGHPFQPVQSFAEKADQAVELQIRRQPDSAPTGIQVTPTIFDPTTLFLDVLKESVEIVERNSKKIGYIHIWSYADPIYQQQLEQELMTRLSGADGLVWDLRDGWGGARLSYLSPFTAPAPTVTIIPRDDPAFSSSSHWQKPVVMLVNQGSRSGKEMLAYAFRKYDVGPIVGSQTAGAVLAGRAFVMSDGSLLYVAVADVLIDGQRLEGQGIMPDIVVPFPIEYAGGTDPQKERAIEVVSDAVLSSE